MSVILIIDDQLDSRDLLLALLAPQGHQVSVACDGVEGLALARAERPDLIITDILMPEMDGYDLARRVRADPWLSETRIVFYTATYLAAEVRHLAAECGVDEIIIKPAEPEAVLEIVRAALRRPPPVITLPPSSITDREYLRMITRALHRKVEELRAEAEARQAATDEIRLLNARLEERVAARTAALQAALAQTEALYRITRMAILSEDLSHSLRQIVEQIAVDLPAHHVTLLLFDSEARTIEHYVRSVRGSALSSPELPVDELTDGLSGWAMRERRTAISPQGEPDPRESPAVQRRRAEHGIGMVVVAPLLYRGQALGALTALNTDSGPDFSASDMSLIEAVASQIAAAYVRARLYESLRQAREEAEQASRAKSEFLSSMSHELRTPLNAVLGFTGTLLMRLPGPLTEVQERQLRTIQSNARHLLSLINDLLDVARIEAGKVEIQLSPTDVLAVVDEVAASLRPLAEAKGLRFLLTTPAHPVTLASDQRALSQILLNLVNNAIKFTERGEVQVTVRQIVGDVGEQVQISVRDTGIGIKAEHQHRLFKAFERAGVEGGRRAEGTGLGLHLSLQLARLLGGTITFQSDCAVGSCFTLVLPAS